MYQIITFHTLNLNVICQYLGKAGKKTKDINKTSTGLDLIKKKNMMQTRYEEMRQEKPEKTLEKNKAQADQ